MSFQKSNSQINWKSTEFENQLKTRSFQQKVIILKSPKILKSTKTRSFQQKVILKPTKTPKITFRKTSILKDFEAFSKDSTLCNLLEKPWFGRILEIFLKTVALAFFSKNLYFKNFSVFSAWAEELAAETSSSIRNGVGQGGGASDRKLKLKLVSIIVFGYTDYVRMEEILTTAQP